MMRILSPGCNCGAEVAAEAIDFCSASVRELAAQPETNTATASKAPQIDILIIARLFSSPDKRQCCHLPAMLFDRPSPTGETTLTVNAGFQPTAALEIKWSAEKPIVS